MRTRRRAVAALVVLALGACTPDAADPAEPGVQRSGTGSQDEPIGGSVTLGVFGEPPTLDPYAPLATDLTFALARPLYPSLVGRETSALARDVDVSPRRAVVTLAHRRWTGGRPVTARDVVASARRATPPSGLAGLSARAAGRRRVVLRGDVTDWRRRLGDAVFIMPNGRPRPGVSAGPLRLVRRTPGLQLVYERNPSFGDRALLDRVVVRFATGTEMLIALLDSQRLDAAWLPSSVNLGARLEELGLEHDSAQAGERVGLDRRGLSDLETAFLLRTVQLELLETGLVRDDGRRLEPPRQGGGRRPSSLRLGAPAGDELLELMQRAIQAQLEGEKVTTELVTADPGRYYGAWKGAAPFPVGLHRGTHHRPSVPMFATETWFAWRGGRVDGLEAAGATDGPLWNVEEWFVPAAGS